MSPLDLSKVMHPTPHPVSSKTFAGCPCPFPVIVRVSARPVVARYSVVFGPSRNSTPVMGSSDSKTVLCFAPRSCMRSPLITVTAPFANPTASWDRFSSIAKAEIWTSQPQIPNILQARFSQEIVSSHCVCPTLTSISVHLSFFPFGREPRPSTLARSKDPRRL